MALINLSKGVLTGSRKSPGTGSVTSGAALTINTTSVGPGTTGNVAQLASTISGTKTFSLKTGTGLTVATDGTVALTSGVSAGNTIGFTARVQNTDGDAVEKTFVLTGQNTVPSAPTVSVSAGNAQVTVNIIDGAANGATITTRKLYRSTTSGFTPSASNFIADVTSPYIDNTVTNGTIYYYKVTNVNSIGEGPASTEQAATPVSVYGLTPPALSTPVTMRWHPNTSTIAMRPSGTFKGYINGSELIVTGSALGAGQFDFANCPALREGMTVTSGGQSYKLLRNDRIAGTPTGGLGSYLVDNTTVMGSSGSPATFTATATMPYLGSQLIGQATSVSDLMGVSNLTSLDGYGPMVKQYPSGRKTLLFRGNHGSLGQWLQAAAAPGIDGGNLAIYAVARFLGSGHSRSIHTTVPFVGLGTYATYPTRNVYTANLCQVATGGPTLTFDPFGPSSPSIATATMKNMFVGQQLQVISTVHASSDGYNGTTATKTIYIGVNEVIATKTGYNAQTRDKSITGLTFNANMTPGGSAPNALSGNSSGGLWEIFDLIVISDSNVGTAGSQALGRMQANITALMNGYGIASTIPLPRWVGTGDSLMAQGTEPAYASYFADGSGISLTSILCEPEHPKAKFQDCVVLNYGAGGQGIGEVAAAIGQFPSSSAYGVVSALHPTYMKGSGLDFTLLRSGTNDLGDNIKNGTNWPTSNNSGLGTAALNTTALADDIWSGSYTGSITIASGGLAASSLTFTPSAYSGVIANGSQITGGFVTGQVISGPGSGSLFSPGGPNYGLYTGGSLALSNYTSATIAGSTVCTLLLEGYLPLMKRMFNNGLGGMVVMAEYDKGAGVGTTFGKFRVNELTAPTAVDNAPAGKVKVVDMATLVNGSQLPYGQGGLDYSYAICDAIHLTNWGREFVGYYATDFSKSVAGQAAAAAGR